MRNHKHVREVEITP